jgi:PP-loop superfamily ATP-utilizing enzyme
MMDSAFSSGVDSSLLVWAAMKYGRDWCACYIHPASILPLHILKILQQIKKPMVSAIKQS